MVKKGLRYILILLIGQISIINLNAQHRSWSVPKEAEMIQNPYSMGLFPERIEKNDSSQFLYSINCAPCHGERGKGDGIARASLEPRPVNLISDKVLEESDGSLFWKISNGHAPMPSFKSSMSDDQIWQVITYLRYLSQDIKPANNEAKK